MKTLTIKELKQQLDLASGGNQDMEVVFSVEIKTNCAECDGEMTHEEEGNVVAVECNHPAQVELILNS